MSRRPRRNHTSALKTKVATAAIKADRTLVQLAEQFDVHPNQISAARRGRQGVCDELQRQAVDPRGPHQGSLLPESRRGDAGIGEAVTRPVRTEARARRRDDRSRRLDITGPITEGRVRYHHLSKPRLDLQGIQNWK
jgi:transposase-like protein